MVAMSYLGSKAGSGVYQAIISQFPPHDVFIDAFFGSGAITRLKPPAAQTYAIDLDPGCIDNFDCAGQQSINLICGDCRSFIAGFDYASRRSLIYCDPPYLHSIRGKARYKYEFRENDHVELLTLLRSLPVASIVISGYPSWLYDDMLNDWRAIEFQAMTRGGIRTEKIWMNFPASAVHWHSYAGQNYTDRQRIKRKAERWSDNFKGLPESERLAVLSAILATL